MKAFKTMILLLVLALACPAIEASATTMVKSNTVENTIKKSKKAKKKAVQRRRSRRCDCTMCDPCGDRGVSRCRHNGTTVYCKYCRRNHIRCRSCRPNDASGCQCDGQCGC